MSEENKPASVWLTESIQELLVLNAGNMGLFYVEKATIHPMMDDGVVPVSFTVAGKAADGELWSGAVSIVARGLADGLAESMASDLQAMLRDEAE